MISDKDYKSIVANGYPRKGDVLLCCVGTIGRTCVYHFDYPIAFQRSVIFMRPKSEISSDFLCYALQSISVEIQENLLINKTAQDGLYMGAAQEIIIATTFDKEEQNRIVSFLEKQLKKIDEILKIKSEQLETMQQHKQSLIFEYVTGKKRVKGAI